MRKFDTETVVQKFIAVHGNDKYDYSDVIYVNSTTNVKIKCKTHNEFFFQNVNSHLKGFIGCKKCSNDNKIPLISREVWIERFNKVHDNKYDYSFFENKYGKKNIKIICKIHGIFEISKTKHYEGVGCGKCAGFHRNNDDWINEFNKIHKNKYDYSLIDHEIRNLTKIKIKCPDHDVFEQRVKNHKRGDGCPKCHRWGLTKDDLLKELIDKYKDTYDYSDLDFKTLKDTIIVNCWEHGPFNVNIYQHLYNNSGCPYCNDMGIGFKKTKFISIANKRFNGLSNLYLIRIFRENESFYKVGVTFYDLDRRFKLLSKSDYKFEKIKFLTGIASEIWALEKLILFMVKDCRYRPENNIYGGETECFDKLETNVFELLSSYEQSGINYLLEYLKNSTKITDKNEIYNVKSKGGFLIVSFRCQEHGNFDKTYNINSVVVDNSCPECVKDENTANFVRSHSEKFNGVFDYSLSIYNGPLQRIPVICNKHGIFMVSPYTLNGCIKCNGKNRTVEEWIEIFKEVHGEVYDYSKISEINPQNKIEIICREHGSFYQYARKHKEGNRCPDCGNESMKEKKREKFNQKKSRMDYGI